MTLRPPHWRCWQWWYHGDFSWIVWPDWLGN